MRVILAVFGVLAMGCATATGAFAFENFIPTGTGYSTDVTTLPEFNSDKSQINQQTDIYETEIYRKKRKYAVDDSNLRRFFSQNDPTKMGGQIDY